MAKGYFDSRKFASGVGREMLNTCDADPPCREDYIFQEMPDFLFGARFGVKPETLINLHEAQIGFCTPTYFIPEKTRPLGADNKIVFSGMKLGALVTAPRNFIYQLRLDGHPNPK